MTKVDEQRIEDCLYGINDRIQEKQSLVDKRKLCNDYLKSCWAFLNISVPFDPEDLTLRQIISKFTDVKLKEPKVFQDDGYHPWLDEARANIKFNFYKRYDKYLFNVKHWSTDNLVNLNKTTDIILDHIGNPNSNLNFSIKGLVMGDIQSGKTANYTGLINKAIDAGYKIIIVLAGITRDLRNQTQARLDKEVTGFQKSEKSYNANSSSTVGVGAIQALNIDSITYIDSKKDYGDLKKFFNVHPFLKDSNPILAIVKKNTSILDNLNKLLNSSIDEAYRFDDDNKKHLISPVLIIDDEADQASVDTRHAEIESEASAINKKIRKIIDSCDKVSYVGYTATPFANIFINPINRTDLYPKDFILALEPSSGYCGIKEYFGIDEDDDIDSYEEDHSTDLFVSIDSDKNNWTGKKINNVFTPVTSLPNSLKDAITSFIISCCIKKERGILGFNSMLINVSNYKIKATSLKPLIQKYITELNGQIRYSYDESSKLFEDFYKENFEQISKERLGDAFKDDWNKIKDYLEETIDSINKHIFVLNGDSNDVLDYNQQKSGDFLIIGGNKLSRGLTLEGLTTSYYFRSARTYDALLQMGRWFGYRIGWLDVCRVYTTKDYLNDFVNVGKAIERFKKDLNVMYAQNLNPREVGQRIMYSPNLIPTSRNKMYNAKLAKISLSNGVQQIITFKKEYIKSNFAYLNEFIKGLGEGEVRENNKVVFKNQPVDIVLKYLLNYHENALGMEYGQISINNWINYIKKVNDSGELKNWTIVLSSGIKDSLNEVDVAGYKIKKSRRTLRVFGDPKGQDNYLIRALINPSDFREFYDPKDPLYKEIDHYDPAQTYPGLDSMHGLLVIYIIDLYELIKDHFDVAKNKWIGKRGNLIEDAQNISAPAIWFPKTKDYENSATNFYINPDYEESHKLDNIVDDEEEEKE